MAVTNWPTITPGETPSSQVQVSPILAVVSFGDNYAQRSADGINAVTRIYQIDYGLLDSTNAATLRNFLNTNMFGQVVRKATVPTDGVQRNWMIESFSETVDTPTTRAFSIQLKQVFDIV